MAVHGQEAHERMGEWQTLAGDRGEHAGLRGGTARVSDAARQSQAHIIATMRPQSAWARKRDRGDKLP